MPTYTSIADTSIDANSPITTSLVTALRDNPPALFEQMLLTTSAKGVVSSEISLASGSQTYTFAHGLGRLPLWHSARLICKTAERGYSVGDEVPIDFAYEYSGGQRLQLVINTTNIILMQQTGINLLIRPAGSGSAVITYANWALQFRVWG